MCAADVWAFACCLLFLEGVEPFHGFDEDPAKLFYLARHQCVAFREGGAFKPFALADCAYAPARHIGQTAWAPILAAAFVPQAARLSSPQLCDRLALLHPHAPDTPNAPDTPTAPDTPHAHAHAKHAHTHRAPLRRLNFG